MASDAPLRSRECLPCVKRGGDLRVLPLSEVDELRRQLCPSWRVSADGTALERHFEARNFRAALAAVNAYGELAEREGHHPDLAITQYRSVAVRLYTHACGGITVNDFIVAAKCDACTVDYAPSWLAAHPEVITGTVLALALPPAVARR